MRSVVVTSFDANYMNYSRVMINQLNDTYRGNQEGQYPGNEILDVVCLVPSTLMHMESEYVDAVHSSNLNIKFRCSEEFEKIVNNDTVFQVGTDRYLTDHCNIRIFLGSLLPEYDKVLYIDPDTFINRSVWPLLRMPMINKFMAWVESGNMNDRIFHDWDRPYFNNGVFLADLNFWREYDAESKMIAWMRGMREKYGHPTPCPEQDAMNAVFMEYLAPLHISANLFNYLSVVPNLSWGNPISYNPIIVHFVGSEKPWLVPEITEWSRAWNEAFSLLWPFNSKYVNEKNHYDTIEPMREIIEFTKTTSEESKRGAPIIKDYLDSHPGINYSRVNEDEEPELRSLIVTSKAPVIHPCFVSLEDGKLVKTHSGEITEEDLDYLAN